MSSAPGREALLWSPSLEQTKEQNGFVDHEEFDDDEEDEPPNQSWFQWLNDIWNSRQAARTALVLALILVGLSLRRYTHRTKPHRIDLPDPARIDWTRFAYLQYATDEDYLCNSLMIFESLARLNCAAGRVLLYPHEWEVGPAVNTSESRLLLEAEEVYGVELVPVQSNVETNLTSGWENSFVKLLAFNQTAYDRVLVLDSDSTVFNVRFHMLECKETCVSCDMLIIITANGRALPPPLSPRRRATRILDDGPPRPNNSRHARRALSDRIHPHQGRDPAPRRRRL